MHTFVLISTLNKKIKLLGNGLTYYLKPKVPWYSRHGKTKLSVLHRRWREWGNRCSYDRS